MDRRITKIAAIKKSKTKKIKDNKLKANFVNVVVVIFWLFHHHRLIEFAKTNLNLSRLLYMQTTYTLQ